MLRMLKGKRCSMANLILLSELARDRQYRLGSEGDLDPTGKAAFGADGTRLGKVKGALVDPDTGRLRFLIMDVGGWFVSKEVLVPVSRTRAENDGVYLEAVTKENLRDLPEYRYGEAYVDDAQGNVRVVANVPPSGVQDLIPSPPDTTGPLDPAGNSPDLAQEGTVGAGYNVGSSREMSGDDFKKADANDMDDDRSGRNT